MSTNIAKPVRRLLDRAQKRFDRSRSGSVLILVVALLVLMALIGTAFMTMAQFDRASAVQHSFNTEVDLLLDGVLNQVKGTITNDVFSSGTFRPTVTISSSTNQPIYYNTPQMPAAPRYWNGLGYDNATAASLNAQGGNTWLASRVPGLPFENQEPNASPVSPNLYPNLPWWPFITAPITGGATFDQPYWPANPTANSIPQYSQRNGVYPTSYVGADGSVWPGFTLSSSTSAPVYMAADADGDGIADSGLVKLLTLDGITYYAAVRIVDNCAAVNPSIALTPNPSATYVQPNAGGSIGQIPGDLSPVNVDLEGTVVNPPSGSGSFPTYLAWTPPADLYASLPTPYSNMPPAAWNGQGLLYNFRFDQPTQTAPQMLSPTPLNDSGTTRSDFLYYPYPYNGYTGGAQVYYYFDQQWMQLGRRLNNPGFIFPQTPPASSTIPVNPAFLYQALPTSESLAMAKHFVVRDPTVISSSTSSSILEMRMPNTVFQSPYANNPSYSIKTPLATYPFGYPTAPYLPAETYKWFLQNFNYWYDFDTSPTTGRTDLPQLAPTMPMRALLAPQNPVSNFAPARFNLNPTGATFQFGDVRTVNGSKYVCICPNNLAAPVAPDQYWSDANWAWEPWTNAPTKTSVNTGTFQQLYAAYWAVMADQYVPGVGAVSGQWFPPFFGANPNNPTSLTNLSSSQYGRMFRNPIRSNNTTPPQTNSAATPVLSSQQVMMLRASLAAVNTMALRHGDTALLNQYGTNDVISRTVYLPPMLKGDSGFQAQVYGVERQPYITQIFAVSDMNQQNSWMAIELYNPYPTAIQMTNWVLATLNRATPGNMAIVSLGNLQTIAGLTTIQPLQRAILVTTATPPSNFTNFPTAQAGIAIYPCSTLTSAFGKELILMRPRRADGALTTTKSVLANNLYTSESNPIDMVPIDSYDFTNIQQPPGNGGSTQEWWYIRPNGVVPSATPGGPSINKEWHFVYPGPWMLSASGTTTTGAKPPTWTGTYSVSPANPSENLSSFGTPQALPKANPLSNYQDTAIQMYNVDFGGPNKATAASASNSLPLGAFPRNGDILQVPFIGSYRLMLLPTTGNAPPTQICEINPVTADSAMATACESSADTQQPISSASTTSPQIIVENVGRFCPIDPDDAKGTNGSGVNDFALPAANQTSSISWRYHWATRIFDFLTVQAPQDDYLPDVDPWLNDQASAAPNLFRYTPAASKGAPQPVANVTSGAANAGLTPPAQVPSGSSEDTAGVNGLINVNTAPWRVLATIPWIPATTAPKGTDNYRTWNAKIAIGLALYRDGNLFATPQVMPHGPFRNLFELGEAKISTMGNAKLRDILYTVTTSPNGAPVASYNYFTLPQGNLALVDGSTPQNNITGDFLATFNTITRISNLVTTRSDSYTAYVLIQGWRNAETPNPQLVVQRRAAVIIDRSSVTPNNRTPNATNVPQ